MIAASYTHCETLADAIALAYQSNPTLQRDRAMLEGIDEGVAQARAGLGPVASLQGAVGYDQTRLGYAPPIQANQGQAQFSLSQTLYSGGRDELAVAAARADVAAGRQTLRGAEGDLLLTVIQAYADVSRDAASVSVREKSVAVLSDEVAESRAREKDGEITRTDVAQAETQLAGERALLSTARGQLQVSRAAYTTAVGRNPGTLEAAPDLPGLPHTIDEAFAISERESPALMQARFAEVGSADRARAARALYRPQITVGITGGYLGAISPFQAGNVERSVSAQVTVTQPLFTNGANGSRIRQALDQNTADQISIEISRRSVVQNVANAWNQVLVAADDTALQRDAVGAAQAAFAGMRIEQRAGQRSTLDVLITEQTLVNAQLLLLSSQHDELVGQASLLRATGRLEVARLVPKLPTYDAAANLRRVEGRGMAPWTALIGAIDGIGAPDFGRAPIPRAPGSSEMPILTLPSSPPTGRLSDTLPTVTGSTLSP